VVTVKITLNIFTRGTVPVWNRFFRRIFIVTADLNLGQFVDETVIDELEREGFFESLKRK